MDKVLKPFKPVKEVASKNETKSSIRPKSVPQKRKVNIINKKLKKLYGNLKKTSMKTNYKNQLFTENPLKKDRKKTVKTRQEKIRRFYSSLPKFEFEDFQEGEKYPSNFETTTKEIVNY